MTPSSRESFPPETIAYEPFSLDALEVTHRAYTRCVEEGACTSIVFKGCKVYTNQGFQIALRVPKEMRAPDYPVTCLDQAQAKAYCTHLGGSLPTQTQWERAARGGGVGSALSVG